MTAERFGFQRNCLANTTGIVLNVGCDEDPARLKSIAPDRVINCDINTYNEHMQRPNLIDVVMDVREPWPFPDNFAELTIFGDILEHLYPSEAVGALSEARRVSSKLCLTVPEDSRWEEDGVATDAQGGRTHCTTWDEEHVCMLLEESGWLNVEEWRTVDYGFVPRGFFVLAV